MPVSALSWSPQASACSEQQEEAGLADAALPCQRLLGQWTHPNGCSAKAGSCNPIAVSCASLGWLHQVVLCRDCQCTSAVPCHIVLSSAGLDVVSLLQDPASQGQSVMLEPMREKALRSVSPVCAEGHGHPVGADA